MNDELIKKIAAASVEVGGALETDKRNQEQRYDYISADKILTVCGQALAKQGIVIFPALVDENIQIGKTRKGGDRFDVKVDFTFIVSDGSAEMIFPWMGRGADYGVPDKALYKAITSGHKYFLMKLLNVGAGNEDGEHDEEEKETKKSAPRQDGRKPRGTPGQPQAEKKTVRPFYEQFAEVFANQLEKQKGKPVPNKGILGAAMGVLDAEVGGERNERIRFLGALLERPITTSTDLTSIEQNTLIAWLKPTKDEAKGWITGNKNVQPTVKQFMASLPKADAELIAAQAENDDSIVNN